MCIHLRSYIYSLAKYNIPRQTNLEYLDLFSSPQLITCRDLAVSSFSHLYKDTPNKQSFLDVKLDASQYPPPVSNSEEDLSHFRSLQHLDI